MASEVKISEALLYACFPPPCSGDSHLQAFF